MLVELKQAGHAASIAAVGTEPPGPSRPIAHRAIHALGDLELISLYDGFFRLDGGAMFGVVPRPLWARRSPPDDRNRIPLAMRPLLVRGVRTMLIDAGVGDKVDAKFRDIYGARSRPSTSTMRWPRPASHREDIDIVLATHLHFDHAGGFTVRDATGRVRPRFPSARYVVRRGEWDDATHPHERNRASYLAENFVPLADAGVLAAGRRRPDDHAGRAGASAPAGTRCIIRWSGSSRAGKRAVVSSADLMPTTAHLPDAWIMGYDLYPMDTLASKKAFARGGDRARGPLCSSSTIRRWPPATCARSTASSGRMPSELSIQSDRS